MVTSWGRILTAVLVALFHLPGAAHAWPMESNLRIDRALRAKAAQRVVVAGRITAHMVNAFDQQTPQIVPGLSHIVFKVEHVLLGDGYSVGDHVRLSTRDFGWPARLLPLVPGARAYLILDPTDKADRIAPYLKHDGRIRSVVPWEGGGPPSVKSPADVERLLAAELVQAIAQETSVHRLRDLVTYATPVLSADQAKAVLTPLTTSEDEWLRHAAIAGLAYTAPTAANLERAVEDLRAFIRRTPAGARFSEDMPSEDGAVIRHGCDAYGMLFAGYSILQSDWSDVEARRLRLLLPLYRIIAAELGKEPYQHWNRGIDPLCRIGDAADVPVLYEYYRAHAAREGGAFPWTAGVRLAVMCQLAAWLDVEVVARSDGTTIEREAEQRTLLEAAYAKYTEDGGD